jgi:toluene monooxygenase electron transfer component
MTHQVEFRRGEHTHKLACASGERLLYAGLQAGLDLAYSCATGTCGSCKATRMSGSTESLWPEAPGARALRSPTDILLCQSVATSDAVIDFKPQADGWPRPRPESWSGVVDSVQPDADGLVWVEIALDRPMALQPGQFVLLAMDGIAGWRAYSPAQSGTPSTRLALLVREAASGAMSPRLCAAGAVGQRLDLIGPLGAAHLRPGADGDLVAVVGGSGASVAVALLDWAEASGHLAQHRFTLVCGLRTLRASALLQRLAAAAARWPHTLDVTVAVSEADADAGLAPAPLRVERGLVHEVAARLASAAWRDRAVFAAGPAPMVQATLRMLMKTARVNPTQVRYDSFT